MIGEQHENHDELEETPSFSASKEEAKRREWINPFLNNEGKLFRCLCRKAAWQPQKEKYLNLQIFKSTCVINDEFKKITLKETDLFVLLEHTEPDQHYIDAMILSPEHGFMFITLECGTTILELAV
jgi:hypothetical protein